MKRIGILTYHYSINEGAIIQGWALQKACQNTWPDAQVEIIDYRSSQAVKTDFKRCFRRPRRPVAVLTALQRRRCLQRFQRNRLKLSRNQLTSDDYGSGIQWLERQHYDAVIVGSDEVWKVVKGGRPFPKPLLAFPSAEHP